jgi:hypothetical protein
MALMYHLFQNCLLRKAVRCHACCAWVRFALLMRRGSKMSSQAPQRTVCGPEFDAKLGSGGKAVSRGQSRT